MSSSAFKEDIKAAVEAEEAFFKSSERPPDLIHTVHLAYDSDEKGLFLGVETRTARYAILIFLSEDMVLGWIECQCLADVMRNFRRSETLTNRTFHTKLDALSTKYGTVKFLADHETSDYIQKAAKIIPPSGKVTYSGPDVISDLKFHIDEEHDMCFHASTGDGSSYLIILDTVLPSIRMTHLECKAFIDILETVETGNKMSHEEFMRHGLYLRKKYNHVVPLLKDGMNILLVRPTVVTNPEPLPPLFQIDGGKTLTGMSRSLSRSSSGGNPPDEEEQMPRFSGLELERRLKISGQAQVYEGKMEGRDVAVKVFTQNSENGVDDASFRTELRMVLKMSRHRNVVQVLDIFERPKPAIVMPFIKGNDLNDYIRTNGRFTEKEGLSIAIAIAEGICHLHQHGIVHRDLKTTNIMRREEDGAPIIIDFGLSSALRRLNIGSDSGNSMEETVSHLAATIASNLHIDQTRASKGTPRWMAPEMIVGQKWSDRTDVYAFGIMLWEIFSGKEPFHDSRARSLEALLIKVVQGVRPSLKAVSHVDEHIVRVMEMCWAPEPEDRPTMERVLDLLRGNDPRQIFLAVDDNGDGKLSFAEFVTFLEQYCAGAVPFSQMHVLFMAIDCDESGSIEVGEFEAFWSQVGRMGLESCIAKTVQSNKLSFTSELRKAEMQGVLGEGNGQPKIKREMSDMSELRKAMAMGSKSKSKSSKSSKSMNSTQSNCSVQ